MQKTFTAKMRGGAWIAEFERTIREMQNKGWNIEVQVVHSGWFSKHYVGTISSDEKGIRYLESILVKFNP
jgi:hypothetical protein